MLQLFSKQLGQGVCQNLTTLLVTIGIASGYFICYGTVKISSSFAWRIPFLVQAMAGFVLALGMEKLPFSPRWLLLVGRTEEAWQVMEQLDSHGVEREKAELQARPGAAIHDATLKETFSEETTRWRAVLAIFLMGMQVRSIPIVHEVRDVKRMLPRSN